ncbi:hypothetical protein E0198_004777 [Clavispora lusitaniae]|nr:hypothetical protein E0198_004777 [Clavispora lusitaniae]
MKQEDGWFRNAFSWILLRYKADNLLAITKAAGASVDNVWADVFAKALEGKNLKELLFSFAASAAPAAAASASSSKRLAAGRREGGRSR